MLVLLAACQYATQITAANLHYDPALAENGLVYAGNTLNIYQPMAYFQWRVLYRAYAPEAFSSGMTVLYVVAAAGIVLILACCAAAGKKAKSAYGTAKFADKEEIKACGLLTNKGVFLGTFEGEFLRDDSDTHLLIFAPTRSGKGVGSIIPTAITWPGSMIFTDLKGELWNITAGCRQKILHNLVFKFQPSSADTVHFNPMSEMRIRTEHEIADVDNLLQIFVDSQPSSKGSDMNYWNQSAKILLRAVMLHLLYTKPDASFPDINTFLFGRADFLLDTVPPEEREVMEEDVISEIVNAPVKARLAYIRDYEHKHDLEWFKTYYKGEFSGDRALHPQIVSACNDLINREDKQFSSIVSNAATMLAMFQDPLLAASVSSSDFHIADLVDREQPASLYFVIPPSDINRLAPVTNLIIELIFNRLTGTDRLQYVNYRGVSNFNHRLLLMFDEFPSFGKLRIMEKALSYCAGYGMKCYLVAQDEGQIIEVYGKNTSILSNTQIKIYQTPTENTTAKTISEAMGKETITVSSRGYGRWRSAFGPRSQNENETGRDLMTVAEVRAMDENDQIIFVKGHSPIKSRKFKYFLQPKMMERLRWPPEHSDMLYGNRESAAEEDRPISEPLTEDEQAALIDYASDTDNVAAKLNYLEMRYKDSEGI